MPFYNDLRPKSDFEQKDYALVFPHMTDDEKKRAIKNILGLRDALDKSVPRKVADENLLIASWNIKEFGHTTQRIDESYFYIAEILSRFDLIAIQEVKTSMKDLEIIMRLMGSDWDYTINDITEGKAGNAERSAYIYCNKRVNFAGLAGEIVLWDELTSSSQIKQLKRTPYITGFKSAWKTFAMICLHLHPGVKREDIDYRREEIELLLKAIDKKVSDGHFWNENLILVGDFNLYGGATKDDPTIEMIHNAGYIEVEGLAGKDTNASQTEIYDRFFLTNNKYFALAKNDIGQDNGGVFNPFDVVFKIGDEKTYKEDYMKKHYGGKGNLDDPETLAEYFKNYWRKNQISDHFPIWFELLTDSTAIFLNRNLAALG